MGALCECPDPSQIMQPEVSFLSNPPKFSKTDESNILIKKTYMSNRNRKRDFLQNVPESLNIEHNGEVNFYGNGNGNMVQNNTMEASMISILECMLIYYKYFRYWKSCCEYKYYYGLYLCVYY